MDLLELIEQALKRLVSALQGRVHRALVSAKD
ncbi:hypothetical protein KOR42_02530 [Thalassoglobus neptunius]|uniref:Uncharacterized protein n=1 Tax=Thalassoglobus neptunius TaxID=1938619 RepID=A0A5C5X240_9PLAN|nr:hypothetical protein KOR42_02530 [Thalassoglobus neptunius]